LREDDIGLAFEIEPRAGQDGLADLVIDMVRDGRVRGMSPGTSRLLKSRESRDDVLADGRVVRTFLRAQLIEISLTDHPNFVETSVRIVDAAAAPAGDASQHNHEIDRYVIGYQDILRQRIRAARVNC
jgi:HK97 family phage prohead protease